MTGEGIGEIRGASQAQVVDLLASVELPVPETVDGIDVAQRERTDGRPVVVLAFHLRQEQLDAWCRAGFPDGLVPRAWVMHSAAADALGISEVPDTWRLDISKPPGIDRERCVLIDDADPAAVRIGITQNPPDERWPESRA